MNSIPLSPPSTRISPLIPSPRAIAAAIAITALPASAQIAAWDFFGENTANATSTAEVFNSSLDGPSTVTRGSTAAASTAGNSFRTTGFKNEGIATSNTDYFQVTLSAAAGYTLSLSTIDAKFAGTTSYAATPGVSSQFAYSLDGTTFTLIGSPSVTTGSPATLPQVSLSGISALQNVPDATTVTIRYYASGQTTTGGWGFNSATAGQYGLAFGGTLAPSGGGPDTTSPEMVSVSPLDDTTDVFPTADLSITYDESIVAGTGTILVKKVSDDTTAATVTVPSAQVQIAGPTATINPTAALEYGTAYYVELPAGAFKDAATNPVAAITGNTAWSFTTKAAPAVVISQYYEGLTAVDRYVELKNLTGSPLPLTGYRLAVWSDTAPSDNEGWKSGTGTTDRVTPLDGYTIPANGSFLVMETGATLPGYAASNNDLVTTGAATAFNGDDSVVLYNGTGFSQAEVVDAVSFSAAQGADTSYYRLNDIAGFDFSTGSSILNYSTTWAVKSLAEVNSAVITDGWYLKSSQTPEILTLAISPASFSEGAGASAATATVTRTGPTTGALDVTIVVSDPTEAAAQATVTIPAGSDNTTFAIDAVNDLYQDGDKQVAITASAAGFTPGGKQITVLDEATDPALPVVINEVDSDQSATDYDEFIELYNTSNAPLSLDGVVMVLYNGATDLSYLTIDLTGQTIPANGYFVVGSSSVPNVNQVAFTSDGLQNGADAVALYLGTTADFPNNAPVASTNGTLVDAVVYDTADADDSGLITALTPGKPQVDENGNSAGISESISRVPNGGTAFDTALFVAQTPTPGATNILVPPNTLASWISGYSVGTETGPNGDFDKDGLGNAVENILGSNPSVGNSGLTSVSSTATTVTFRHNLADSPATDLTKSYEWSTNLATWYPSGPGGGVTVAIGAPVVITDGSPNNLIEVTASVTSGTPSNLFVRLKVTNP